MGIFSFLKREPRPSLEQLSYDVAYQILPGYVFGQLPALFDIVNASPDSADPLFYQMACKAAKVQPDRAAFAQYKWHRVDGFKGRTFLVLSYPEPVPVDLSGKSFVEVRESAGTWVLAPYFSAVVKDEASGKVHYFVLGQTSMGGGTALRRMDADWSNTLLGPGPAPSLDAFVTAIEPHLAAPSA